MTTGRPARLLAMAGTLLSLLALAVPAQASPGPIGAPEWWFDSWQVDQLWAGGADGRGITVAVIDTGVQASLPELSGRVLPGADLIGNGSDGRIDYDTDAFSHGTAMASIIVARSGLAGIEGLAPGARVLPVSVPLRGVVRNGKPTVNATSVAIDYAADHGARIINLSLGGVRDPSDGPDPCPSTVQAAVLHALSRGALVVAASGNSGGDGSPVEEPGVCLGVISVGAVNRQLAVLPFSSRHPYLTVSAPGDNIPSLSRDSAYIGEGTSQATAMTSAALALIWSKYPTETNRQVLTRLLSTTTDRGPAGRDSSYGLGVINPAAAIAAHPAAGAPNLVFDGAQPLLALNNSKAYAPRAVPAAGRSTSSLGTFRVGSAAAAASVRFYLLVAGTAAFALLAGLFLLLFVRRRPARRVPYGLR
ncbi:MAG TPA: S8 family serine peptidase [Jatrophihabitans sp.]|nr:S8 family serine peptidase [Jatrophihabitans sp.]